MSTITINNTEYRISQNCTEQLNTDNVQLVKKRMQSKSKRYEIVAINKNQKDLVEKSPRFICFLPTPPIKLEINYSKKEIKELQKAELLEQKNQEQKNQKMLKKLDFSKIIISNTFSEELDLICDQAETLRFDLHNGLEDLIVEKLEELTKNL